MSIQREHLDPRASTCTVQAVANTVREYLRKDGRPSPRTGNDRVDLREALWSSLDRIEVLVNEASKGDEYLAQIAKMTAVDLQVVSTIGISLLQLLP